MGHCLRSMPIPALSNDAAPSMTSWTQVSQTVVDLLEKLQTGCGAQSNGTGTVGWGLGGEAWGVGAARVAASARVLAILVAAR